MIGIFQPYIAVFERKIILITDPISLFLPRKIASFFDIIPFDINYLVWPDPASPASKYSNVIAEISKGEQKNRRPYLVVFLVVIHPLRP